MLEQFELGYLSAKIGSVSPWAYILAGTIVNQEAVHKRGKLRIRAGAQIGRILFSEARMVVQNSLEGKEDQGRSNERMRIFGTRDIDCME
jgi:hypothetical protein